MHIKKINIINIIDKFDNIDFIVDLVIKSIFLKASISLGGDVYEYPLGSGA